MAEVNKGKPQKRLKLYILVEVLKEGPNFKSEDTGRVPPEVLQAQALQFKGILWLQDKQKPKLLGFLYSFS